MISNFFFFENLAVYETMWKNAVKPGRPQMTIWCMRIACWIPKATNTHTEYVIVINFPRNNGCTNAPQCHFICTLPVLSTIAVNNQNTRSCA
jgi:hypothetical protein